MVTFIIRLIKLFDCVAVTLSMQTGQTDGRRTDAMQTSTLRFPYTPA